MRICWRRKQKETGDVDGTCWTTGPGGVTIWAFDTLDRKISETYQDGSSREFVYDLANDVVTYTDENGSVFSNTWDLGACLGG